MAALRYKILCSSCGYHLYDYYGKFAGNFDAQNFRPANPKVTPPGPRREMRCVNCGQPWYMVTSSGSLLVKTDRGIKPREPTGRKKLFSYPEELLIHPEMPESMRGGKADYVEPNPLPVRRSR